MSELTTFNEIIEKVLEHEGGYVNDPTDRGGETKYGITKKFYPDVDIKNLTLDQAKHIYHTDYWRRAKCDEIPPKLRHIYFDMTVNFGKRGAVKVLGPVGDVVEQWTLKGSWIQAANFNDLDFASSDPVDISVTLRYDYAILEF